MVVGARKLLGSALVLTLAGSLLGGPTAAAADSDMVDADGAELSSYTFGDLSVAPNRAPVGGPVEVHGFIGRGLFSPASGEPVTIYFDPSGTAPRAAVATVTANDDGWFAKTLSPRTSGTYDILPQGSSEIIGQGKATFTSRPASRPVRSAVVSATKDGVTAKVRVIVQDVVTRVDPQTVHLDGAILTPGFPGIIYSGPYMKNRRAEGRFGVGEFYGAREDVWRTNYSATRSYRMSAVHPAGLYSVYFPGEIAVYTDRWDADGDSLLQDVRVPLPYKVVTTVRVRRASITTISASSTEFTGSKTITLRGAVRKVKLITDTQAGLRLSPDTPVKLYFDPAGSAGPVYKKTVRTGSDGVYTTKVGTSTSGKWIAKYPGTDLQAPSKRAVTVTVR